MSTRRIDLHGYTREKALRCLTDTLEVCKKQGEQQLVVITGVGQHSQIGGAVLRPSVQKYLEERRFYYKYQSGCFEIEVKSGELRYMIKTAPSTTKLLHTSSLPIQQSLPSRQKKKIVRAATLPEDLSNGPSPKEAAQDEKVLEQGKRQSLEDYREFQKSIRQEKKAIDRALELSAHDDCSASEENEDKLLEAVVERSKVELKMESDQRLKQEEELLQQVIDMSMNDYTESSTLDYRDEDGLFRTVLEQSAIEAKENDDDELLRRAIQLSKEEVGNYPVAVASQATKDGV